MRAQKAILLLVAFTSVAVCQPSVSEPPLNTCSAGNMLLTLLGELQQQVQQLRQDVLSMKQDISKFNGSYASPGTSPEPSFCFAPSSCNEIHKVNPNSPSGSYKIYPDGQIPGMLVRCDMASDEYGWVVFQRRTDGAVNFHRTWAEYEEGFGDLAGEFWLGNEALHRLTAAQPSTLRVDLEDWDGQHRTAFYSNFSIGGAADKYRLSVSEYSGDAGDSLGYHNTGRFSTLDQDNDDSSSHCAVDHTGGWWFRNCDNVDLNGRYHMGGAYTGTENGIEWVKWRGSMYSYKTTEMKIKQSVQ